jgi:O-antigen biosynthesis protein
MSAKPNLLIIIHQYFEDPVTGGVEFHVQDTISILQNDYNCFIAYIWHGMLVVGQYEGEKVVKYAFPFSLSPNQRFVIEDDLTENLLQRICIQFKIDLIHVHHTLRIGFDIFKVGEFLNIPIIYTLHDYYTIHPDFNLLYKFDGKKYHEDKELSDEELLNFTNNQVESLTEWRIATRKTLENSFHITAPSQTVFNEINAVFPEFAKKSSVLPLGLPFAEKKEAQDLPKTKKICFYGTTYYPNKGRFIALEIIPQLLAKGIEVHFIGSTKDHWLELPESPLLHFHGPYERTQGVEILYKLNPNCTVFLPICKETFGFTLSESWIAGIPAISSPIGAYGERINTHGGGIVLSSFDPEVIINEIITFINDEELQTSKRSEIQTMQSLSLESTVEFYRRLYTQALANNSEHESETSSFASRTLDLQTSKETYLLVKQKYEENIKQISEIDALNRLVQQKKEEIDTHLGNWKVERSNYNKQIDQLKDSQKNIAGIKGAGKHFVKSILGKVKR